MIDAKDLLETLSKVKEIYLTKSNEANEKDLRKMYAYVADGVDLSIQMVESQCRINGVEYENGYVEEDVWFDESKLA